MSIANRPAPDVVDPKDCQSTRPRKAKDARPTLSIYNVRFPANICEHLSGAQFVRRPAPLPGRGGGAVVVATVDQPKDRGPRLSTSTSSRKKDDRLKSRRGTISFSSEVKMMKRDPKNRYERSAREI